MKPKHISQLAKKDIKDIKLIVLDVDGVLVKRGTKIKQSGNKLKIEIKKIPISEVKQIKQLHKQGYYININSGRGLYMLEEMFGSILPYISLTYENGSATWYKGKVFQHVNSFSQLKEITRKLKKIKSKNIKGFEPKEFTITLHCKKRVKKIEQIMARERNLYSIWNDEAYDIGIKSIQTKSNGLKQLSKILKLKKKNILAIGDNYNDKQLLGKAGLAITADKSRLNGDFYVELKGKELPAERLMEKLIELA